jgi:hypothetical protein
MVSLYILFIQAAFGLFCGTVTNSRSFILIIAGSHGYIHCNGLGNEGVWTKGQRKIDVEAIAAFLNKGNDIMNCTC